MGKSNRKQKNTSSISYKFLIFMIFIVTGFGIYNNYFAPKQTKIVNDSPVIPLQSPKQDTVEEEFVQKTQEDNPAVVFKKKTSVQNKPQELTNKDKYNQLLENLQKYPAKSINSVEIIIKKILEFKGYPENIITLEINDSLGETQKGSYVAAFFNFQTGKMHINQHALYNISIQQAIAIIAHELDHFDKINQVCKSMGIRDFSAMMASHNVENLNIEFWSKSSQYANLNNFDSDYYKNSLIRYISQSDIEVFSSYSDLYKMAEHMRNPLEISAYEVSDYILDYYNVSNIEGPMQKLIKRFNSLDWTLYNKIKDNNILNKQRIAIFDYYFAKAITKSHQDYQQSYDYCMSSKDGNLTSFWISFEKNNESFYLKKLSLNSSAYNNILNILTSTENIIRNATITDDIVYEALKIKINTLLDNIIYEGAITNIKNAAYSYLQYSKLYGNSNQSDELKFIMTLICFENDYYSNVQNQTISMFNMKIPQELKEIYNINSVKELVDLISSNSEFQKQYEEKKKQEFMLTEESFFSDLIFKYRPYLKITSKS